MTLKIETEFVGRKTVIRLSGRLQAEHVDELRTHLAGEPSGMALDLEAVTLVDVEMVRFLNVCEESGVELLHCCGYIREWMAREKAGG
jgi:anti-anti-sigma regulatory factor